MYERFDGTLVHEEPTRSKRRSQATGGVETKGIDINEKA